MTSARKDTWIFRIGLAAIFSALLRLVTGCGLTEPHVASATQFRDVVCALASSPQLKSPEAKTIRDLCARESDLKALAAAYAGCNVDN